MDITKEETIGEKINLKENTERKKKTDEIQVKEESIIATFTVFLKPTCNPVHNHKELFMLFGPRVKFKFAEDSVYS